MPRPTHPQPASVGQPVIEQVQEARAAAAGQAATGPAYRMQAEPYQGPMDFASAVTTFDLFAAAAARHAGRPCLGWQNSGEPAFTWLTYAQTLQASRVSAKKLRSADLEKCAQ